MASLFDRFTLKSVTLKNRIAVSPMCQYSAEDGFINDWHLVHLAGLARGGAGLVIAEASAVSPEGRISWADAGLWSDAHRDAFRPAAEAIKKAGAVPGVQIAHAGRKASANRPWEGDDHLPESDPRGWPIIGPSPVAQGGGLSRVPNEMTKDDIVRVRRDFAAAAKRAREAGFEWLELHFAHGYLAQSFFSRHANRRTDEYGGSFENRARFLLETFDAVRAAWPDGLPLTARFGVIEFDGHDEETLEESIELVRRLKAAGLDFIDVSIGFTTNDAKIPWGPNFMAPVARRVKAETGLPAATSWYISDPKEADALIRDGDVDLVMLGRPLLANPHWPFEAAKALVVEKPAWATLPAPYAHWLSRYRTS